MKKGYFTPPVLIILAIIIFAVAILIAINTDLVKRIKKEPLLSSSPSPTTQQSPPQESLDTPLCDVNTDGKCNVADLDLLNKALGTYRGQKDYVPLADLDADGMINDVDKQTLLKLLDQNQAAETANWKTYTSDDGELSFMYPLNWRTLDCVNLTHFKGICFFSSDYKSSGIKHEDNWDEEIDIPKSGIAMSIVTSNKENFGEVLRCSSVEDTNVSCDELKVGGKDAVKVVKSQPSLNTEPLILDVRTTVISNDNVYQILFTFLQSDQAEAYKIANPILSTFKFLD